MESVKSFMQEYFDARIEIDRASKLIGQPFRDRFYTEEYRQASDTAHARSSIYHLMIPSVVLSVTKQGGLATVITSEPEATSNRRRIYKLRLSDRGWKIEGRGNECFLCDGSGQQEGDTCTYCGGHKWRWSEASKR